MSLGHGGEHCDYYITDGDLTKITDGSGREVQLKYKSSTDGKKVVSRITKPDGTKIDIAYTTARIRFRQFHSTTVTLHDLNMTIIIT